MSTRGSYKGKNMYGEHVYVYKSGSKEIARGTGSSREDAKAAADADLRQRGG